MWAWVREWLGERHLVLRTTSSHKEPPAYLYLSCLSCCLRLDLMPRSAAKKKSAFEHPSRREETLPLQGKRLFPSTNFLFKKAPAVTHGSIAVEGSCRSERRNPQQCPKYTKNKRNG